MPAPHLSGLTPTTMAPEMVRSMSSIAVSTARGKLVSARWRVRPDATGQVTCPTGGDSGGQAQLVESGRADVDEEVDELEVACVVCE